MPEVELRRRPATAVERARGLGAAEAAEAADLRHVLVAIDAYDAAIGSRLAARIEALTRGGG